MADQQTSRLTNLYLDSLPRPAAELLEPGGEFELTEIEIRGVRQIVFSQAPASLRLVYLESLQHENETFYVYEDERYTFGEAWHKSQQVVAGLRNLGVEPGDRVGIAMRNYPEWVFVFMAVTSMDAVAVAMNAWWTGDEMMFAINDSGLKTLFVDRERLEHISPYLDETPLDVIAVRTARISGRGVCQWSEFVDTSVLAAPLAEIRPDTPATILYTSGSTSRPKGVVSSHRAIIHSLMGWEASAAISRAVAGRRVRPVARQPSMIITVPLFHVTGLNGQLLPSLRNGRKVVGMYKWEVDKALAIIEREKVTHFSGVPTMAYELVNSPNYVNFDLSSLRSIGGGGAAMTPKHSQRIAERSNNQTRASAAYGMTETNGLAASNAGDNLKARPTSCGKALPPLVQICIVDKQNQPLMSGEVGEICIKGAMNFSGYWNNPEATAETLVDGWLHTGDLGYLDEQDFLFITDREKDLIIRGGENIGCQEVEAVIYEHAKVIECIVFSVPDERLGETVAAVVVVANVGDVTAGDIRSHVAERLARFKVPEHVLLETAQLPRTASGKIFKREVQAQTVKRLSISVAV